MEIKDLNAKVDQLAELRKQKNVVKELVDKMRMDFEQTIQGKLDEVNILSTTITETQNELLAVLKEAGNKSWRTDKATITVKTINTYTIEDKAKVMKRLDEMKLTNEYTRVEFIPQIKVLFEKEAFDGVKVDKKDYISVLVKKDEKA